MTKTKVGCVKSGCFRLPHRKGKASGPWTQPLNVTALNTKCRSVVSEHIHSLLLHTYQIHFQKSWSRKPIFPTPHSGSYANCIAWKKCINAHASLWPTVRLNIFPYLLTPRCCCEEYGVLIFSSLFAWLFLGPGKTWLGLSVSQIE